MIQKQNRHSSMSVYLAVLAVDDTIVLASARKPTIEFVFVKFHRIRTMCSILLPLANEVRGKVMFSHLSVSHFVQRGCTHPWEDIPRRTLPRQIPSPGQTLLDRHYLGRDPCVDTRLGTPHPGQTSWTDTPSRHPLWTDTP